VRSPLGVPVAVTQVAVLDAGRVVELGTQAEPLARDGAYAALAA